MTLDRRHADRAIPQLEERVERLEKTSAGGQGGSAVSGVASVNGMTGDVTIRIPGTTSDLVNTSGYVSSTTVASALNDLETRLMSQLDSLREDIPEAYVHPITSGYKHIPSGGSSGQILEWASDGTARWVDNVVGDGSGSGNSDVTGVKGNAESSYRRGNVNLTPENLGIVSLTEAEIEELTPDVDDGTGSIPIATNAALGCVIAGNGLDVDEQGILTPSLLPGAVIVESGTDNGWYYQKYSDGRYMAMRTATMTIGERTAYGNVYRGSSTNTDVVKPSFVSGTPTVYGHLINHANFWPGRAAITADGYVTVTVWHYAAGSTEWSGGFRFIIYGTWDMETEE